MSGFLRSKGLSRWAAQTRFFRRLRSWTIFRAAFIAKEERHAAVGLCGLLLCAAFAGGCGGNDHEAIKAGGASRLSLFHLRKRLIAHGDVLLRHAIQFILQSMVLSQHFATADNRFDGQNQRLRLCIEEGGLFSVVGRPWEPTVAEDRLPTILTLADDCGLVLKVGDGFHVRA